MNPRQESRTVANEIERFVREEGYRYKDIVVLTADLDSYQNELEKSFDDLHIPYFVDVNRKLLNNPCIETLLSVLKMIQKDFSYDMVFRYLKSVSRILQWKKQIFWKIMCWLGEFVDLPDGTAHLHRSYFPMKMLEERKP